MDTKLKIDIANGTLEVYGQEKFVEKIYNDFKTQLAELGKKVSRRQEKGSFKNGDDKKKDDDLSSYENLAEVFGSMKVKKINEVDTVLIASAYLQEKNDLKSGFGSQDVNSELKNLGQGIKNITRALDGNIAFKPQTIIQLKKSGTTKQGKKLYKVTTHGIEKTKKMLIMEEEKQDG